MIKKYRFIRIDEKDIITFLKIVDEIKLIWFFTHFYICEWKVNDKEDETVRKEWAVSFRVTDKKWNELLRSLKEKDVILLETYSSYIGW